MKKLILGSVVAFVLAIGVLASTTTVEASSTFRDSDLGHNRIMVHARRGVLVGNAEGQASSMTQNATSFGVSVRLEHSALTGGFTAVGGWTTMRGSNNNALPTGSHNTQGTWHSSGRRNSRFQTEFQRQTAANGTWSNSVWTPNTLGW